jgi:hypothetical protein
VKQVVNCAKREWRIFFISYTTTLRMHAKGLLKKPRSGVTISVI